MAIDFSMTRTLPAAEAAPTLRVAQLIPNHAGAKYEGDISVSTRRREGHGKYFYPNAFFEYEGQWVDGQKHGQGRLSFADGGFYEGTFEKGEIVGEGCRNWADGSAYEGQFLDGMRHGEGTWVKPSGTRYEGSWQHGKYGGEGSLTLPSGESYQGTFVAHRYHGRGDLSRAQSGLAYSGCFADGLFEGEGELSEREGAFTYKGQFKRGKMAGAGEGTDTVASLTHRGEWADGVPEPAVATWGLGVVGSEESYMQRAEALKVDAATQLNETEKDRKKDKGKKADPKKDKFNSQPGAEEPVLPELLPSPGAALPEVALRLISTAGEHVTAETGRKFRVTMYKERKVVSKEDPNEAEILRRPVRFNDRRETYVDPLDEPPASGKASPAPKAGAPAAKGKAGAKAADSAAEPEEPPSEGDEAREGVILSAGEVVLGGTEEWFIPVHLVPAIYWLRIEDSTEFERGSPWQRLPDLEVPIRVVARDGK